MALLDVSSIKGMKVVSDDAYDLGTVVDLRYRAGDWKVMGVKMVATSRPKEYVSQLRNDIFLEVSGSFGYAVKDVFLTRKTLKDTVTRLSPDSNKFDTTSSLIGNKVITNDGAVVGTVDTVMFNPEAWVLVSITMKLTPEGHKLMNVKKGLVLSKKVSGVLMTFVESATEGNVKLKVSAEKLKSSVVIL